jgi:hypothetical protein
MPYDIRQVYGGPPRQRVPRGQFTNQAGGKVVGVRVLRRKRAENRYGGSGWDPSKVRS